MSIDRNELRDDAEGHLRYGGGGDELANGVLALLDALDQAEAELGRLKYHYLYNPGNECPTCAGPIHRDMAGIYWTTRSAGQEQAEAERDWNLRSSRRAKEQRIKANTRADQAEARIQAVRTLHVATGPSGVICNACNVVTPCPTIRVLDSDGDPGQSCGRGPCALGYGHPGACRR